VLVSDELLTQAEQQRRAMESGAVAAELQGFGTNGDKVVWPAAVRCAVLMGLIAAGLTLISLVLPPVALLAWFWAIGAPVIALGIYSSRFRQTRLRPGFGAQLGLLCGLAVFVCMTTVNTVGLVLFRLALHRGGAIDGQLSAMFAQMRATIQAQGGPAEASALAWIAKPEARLGLLLTMTGIVLMIYLVISAAGGAFAALLRLRSSQR
jgi:hypothetical protein